MSEYRQILKSITERPTMYFDRPSFLAASSFLYGYDVACQEGVLLGFREWLVMRIGSGTNLVWQALVLRLAFPDARNPEDSLVDDTSEQRATRMLYDLFVEFDEERSAPNRSEGTRRLMVRYQEWLKRHRLA